MTKIDSAEKQIPATEGRGDSLVDRRSPV